MGKEEGGRRKRSMTYGDLWCILDRRPRHRRIGYLRTEALRRERLV